VRGAQETRGNRRAHVSQSDHPDIDCDGRSSPPCNMLLGVRRMVSDDSLFLSQLDTAFDVS
jgi:sulfotransferase